MMGEQTGTRVLKQAGFMPVEPKPKAVPHVWHWANLRTEALVSVRG